MIESETVCSLSIVREKKAVLLQKNMKRIFEEIEEKDEADQPTKYSKVVSGCLHAI